MRVLIRTDASARIGSGHVMRCLTLAQALKGQGAEVDFVCRELPGHMTDWIERQGFAVRLLPAPAEPFAADPAGTTHGAWLGVAPEQDAAETGALLGELKPDWLIVDHYALDASWERQLRPLVSRLMVIDDLADRPHDCDLLLDQNYYHASEARYESLLPPGCQRLLGPRFALLREEFRKLPAQPHLEGPEGLRVLVFFGGTDATDETGKVLSALERLAIPGLTVEVVVGASNPHSAAIEARTSALPGGIFHSQVTNMAELMARADLFVGAGGTTNWERCYFGLPSLVVTVARNQEETTSALAETGRLVYLGPAAQVTVDRLETAIAMILENPHLRAALSAASRMLVDGRGAQRVARLMGAGRLELRRARQEDCERVFMWRNAEETRRYIFDPAPIPWEDHQAWFARALQDPHRILLLGIQEGIPVGVLRYDLSDAAATISVYLDPARSGGGLGTSLIASGSAWLREHVPSVQRVRAEVMEGNIASHQAFMSAGYRAYNSVYVDELHAERRVQAGRP